MAEVIPDLPNGMQVVPDTAAEWLAWRERVLAFRVYSRRRAESDMEYRAGLIRFAAKDKAFFLVVYGVIHEPRNVRDLTLDEDGEIVEMRRQKGWYPWIPYAFQVRVIREIDETLATVGDESGKDDLLVEKSRTMGLTWLFCESAAHDWLFDDDVFVGLYSHKEALVDSDNPSSMFYKIESQLGINRKVPELCHSPGTLFHDIPVRLPDYLIPGGFDPKQHDHKLNLKHPTKTNQIFGEATTSRSGIGSRTTYNIIDEAAKIKNLMDIWSGQSAVTDHRFALSSADRRESDDMYLLVEQARHAQRDPMIEGPRLLTLPWHVHPLYDEQWYNRMKARHGADPHGFAREYEIDWNAGLGDWVYPIAKTMLPVVAPYEPGVGQVFCTIDPAIRDATAVVWIQYMPGESRYRVVEALILQTPSAEFLAPILMGFPTGHEERLRYSDHSIHEVMDFTWGLRGLNVLFVGDPYGDNVGGASSDTFYTVLWQKADELNQKYADTLGVPATDLMVMTKYDEGARYHRGRKEALTKKLAITDFHNTARVRYVLEAIQNNRYKSQDENRMVQNDPLKPAHDWTSHPTTACEFWAVLANINELNAGPSLRPTVPSIKRGGVRPPTPGYTPVAAR